MLLNKEIITWNSEFGQPFLLNIEKAYISEEPPESFLFKLSLESLQLCNMQ